MWQEGVLFFRFLLLSEESWGSHWRRGNSSQKTGHIWFISVYPCSPSTLSCARVVDTKTGGMSRWGTCCWSTAITHRIIFRWYMDSVVTCDPVSPKHVSVIRWWPIYRRARLAHVDSLFAICIVICAMSLLLWTSFSGWCILLTSIRNLLSRFNFLKH